MITTSQSQVIRPIVGITLSMLLVVAAGISTGSVIRSVELTVETDQPQYYLDEDVSVFGRLTENGTGIEGSPVCLDIIDSQGISVIGFCGVTLPDGGYTFDFVLPNTTALGVCYASVHAVVYNIYANTTFEAVSTTIIVEATGPGSGIVGVPVSFNVSATGGKIPYEWWWDFGDNTTSSEQNPVHVYTTADDYTVVLTVTDAGGMHGMDAIQLSIVQPLVTITLKPGIGLNFDIQNTGQVDVTNISFEVSFDGGLLLLPRGGYAKKTIEVLAPQEHEEFRVIPLGLGKMSMGLLLQYDGVPPTQQEYTILLLGLFVFIIG
ncbi:MAG: PKD domain-containing protein [Candidatus Thermoplasmatota archaeon]|nr:PKD domain-containing protein [Candidatus Thermoplasmatota archaeon]